MWFLNQVIDPLVALLLRSPLHRLLDSRLLLLTYHGRRSGRRITLPVMYAADPAGGDRLLVVPGWPERKRWWRNFRKPATVQVLLRGVVGAGHAAIIGDSAGTADALAVYLDRFPQAARQQRVRRAPGGWRADDLAAAAARAVVVRIELASGGAEEIGGAVAVEAVVDRVQHADDRTAAEEEREQYGAEHDERDPGPRGLLRP